MREVKDDKLFRVMRWVMIINGSAMILGSIVFGFLLRADLDAFSFALLSFGAGCMFYGTYGLWKLK